jgi:hypothetical protein
MRDRQNGYGRTASSARARRWCPLIVVLADEVPPARHMPGTGPEHRAESAPQLLLSQSWAPAHAGSSDTGPGCGRDRDPRLVCPAPCVAPTCRARRQAEREQVMYGAQNNPTGRPSKHGCGPAEGLQIRRDCAPHSCRAPITQRELGRRPGGSCRICRLNVAPTSFWRNEQINPLWPSAIRDHRADLGEQNGGSVRAAPDEGRLRNAMRTVPRP